MRRIILAALALCGTVASVVAQPLDERFDACKDSGKGEFECALALAPADVRSEIAEETVRMRALLGPRTGNVDRPDYQALIPATLRIAGVRAGMLVAQAPKEKAREIALISETGIAYARVAETIAQVTVRVRAFSDEMGTRKSGGIEALDVTEKLTLEVIELTAIAQLELRRAVARRAIFSMRGECDDPMACINFAADFLTNDSMRWGLNRDDAMLHLRESAVIDLLYLIEVLESRT